MSHISFNGKIMTATEPLLLAANRGYRYGDGLFETMKAAAGQIRLFDLHMERLFAGLVLLKMELPKLLTADKLQQEILQLCRKNGCEQLARVRLSFFRGNGGLYDDDRTAQYIIECWPLPSTIHHLNENGLVIGIYPDARKNCDQFAALKSANFLPYTMAAIFARENKWNDCLVLNNHGHIADSTIANIFLVKDDCLYTPALSEGCVSGVMRKHLLASLQQAGMAVKETTITIADLENADEVFLTNAIHGIRWVRQLGGQTYGNETSVDIFNRFIKTI